MLLLKARIKRRNRRVWVRGWITRRQEMRAYHRIVRELATEEPSSFMEYLRMDEDHLSRPSRFSGFAAD